MKLLSLLLITICCSLQAQQTERFNKLVKELEKVSVKTDTTLYRNGQIKSLNEQTIYTFDNKEYKTWTGEDIFYYKNGKLGRKSVKDDYGNFLNEKFYDRSGNIVEERITTEIDNRATSLIEYLQTCTSYLCLLGDNKKTISYYKYSRKSKLRFLYKQESIEQRNGILTQTNNTINEDGKIIKILYFFKDSFLINKFNIKFFLNSKKFNNNYFFIKRRVVSN